jgi:hypothetical protein
MTHEPTKAEDSRAVGSRTDTEASSRRRIVRAVLYYGAAWGFIEATLGYLLHLLRRLTPLPGLTAYVLFPIGFFLMLAAYRATGRSISAFLVAATAAAVKLCSVALPGVEWIFVVNPAISILSEGLVVLAALQVISFGRDWSAVPKATAISVAWRGVFLLLVILLPVQKGILMKGATAFFTFLLVDSLVNGVLIGGALMAGADGRRLNAKLAPTLTPIGTGVVVFAAVGAELLFSSL